MAAATSEKNSSTGRKNGIGGFIIDKIDGEVMMKYIKENDLAEVLGGVDDEMSTEQVGVALAMHFKNTLPAKQQVKCDVCCGISDKDADSCPFCGDNGEVVAETKAPEDEEEDEPARAKSAPSKEEGEAIDEEDEEEEADDVEEDEEEDGDIEGTAQVAAAPKGKPEKTAKKKGSKTTMATASTANGAAKKSSKSTALAKKGAVGSALVARDLDKARDEVIEIKSRGARDYWEMGEKLAEIHKKNLWKLRVNTDTGKNKYNGFDAFVIAELQMSPMSAYRAIEVAEKYTKEEAYALGTTKASLILQAAPQDRKKLAAAAKKGASKRTIEKGVKESRAKHGSPKKSQQAKAGAKGGTKKATATAARTGSEKISIASIEGQKTIKLHKKPESFKDVVFSKLPRAAKLGDHPVGRFEMGNGVVQYYEVRNGEDGLVLKILTRREAAE